MDTQERVQVQPATPIPQRRRLGLSLLVVLGVVVAAATAFVLFVGGGGDGPVAAADAEPRIIFDGTTCRYDGPQLIEAGTVAFTVTNTAERAIRLASFRMPEATLDAELERTPLGTDRPLPPTDPRPSGSMAALILVGSDAQKTESKAFRAGTHIMDCVPPNSDHLWRAGTLVEFVAP